MPSSCTTCVVDCEEFERKEDFEEEGFFLNNVKYIQCPAAQGAIKVTRSRSLLYKPGLKMLRIFAPKNNKLDFDEPREWIFADREDNYNYHKSRSTSNSSLNSSSFLSLVADKENQSPEVEKPGPGIFKDLRICLVEMEDRKPEFKRIVETNGGKVILDLVQNRVDILLTTNPSGANYENAKAWSMACIHPLWVEKSVAASKLLPIGQYRIVREQERDYGFDKKSLKSDSSSAVMTSCFRLLSLPSLKNANMDIYKRVVTTKSAPVLPLPVSSSSSSPKLLNLTPIKNDVSTASSVNFEKFKAGVGIDSADGKGDQQRERIPKTSTPTGKTPQTLLLRRFLSTRL